MFQLDTPVKSIYRVGLATANQLATLGVKTIEDLLYFFPFRYEDYSKITPIAELKADQQATVIGRIISVEAKRSPRKFMKMTEALITDEYSEMRVVWFNQPYLAKTLKVGQRLFLAGKVAGYKGEMQFSNPHYEVIVGEEVKLGKIEPVYHATARLTQKQLRFLTNVAIEQLPLVTDWLPEEVISKYKLLSLREALHNIHYPQTLESVEEAAKRLKFQEVFLMMLQSAEIKKFISTSKAKKQSIKEGEVKAFVASLPFKLTDDQRKAAWQMMQDLTLESPMNRLLEGDVGSGKTLVAAIALYQTILNGQQGVLMCPTEILAHQHYQTITKFLDAKIKNIILFTQSSQFLNGEKITRPELLELLKNGQANLIIGTHALISDAVSYKDLGLVVVDEQHRFGVGQRKSIKDKNLAKTTPHFLSLTATPIPRSLALIVYGELEVSFLKELPPNRQAIKTNVVPEYKRQEAYDFIRQQVKEGRQVFVVCPLIDPSDTLGVKSVTEEHKRLSASIFPDLEIGLLHGKLKGVEKAAVMEEFKKNKTKILVSTSVIEVGIDIPNASVMMIEGAERFGLAQLHQFRGRVGRGADQSYCFLFPSKDSSQQSVQRLNLMEQTNDGFKLAEYDLQLRGPGEVYGVRQSGLPEFKLASLNDSTTILQAKEALDDFLANHAVEDYPELKEKLRVEVEKVHLE